MYTQERKARIRYRCKYGPSSKDLHSQEVENHDEEENEEQQGYHATKAAHQNDGQVPQSRPVAEMFRSAFQKL